jgi:uncharacterized Ntn-hydrolase superfamily protein
VTYSIVAVDGETGELGVAVQSRAFAAGAGVGWARPGVGAVATQALGERSYGPLGLELLAAGKEPAEALAALIAADEDAELRQVAILAADGHAAAHTGSACIAAAGHITGDGFSVQGNILRSERVWEAMAERFEAERGSLARRLLAALEAGQEAGGDWRGQQAAGLLVVPAEGQPWDRVSDLRVDDHPEPLRELRRLLEFEEAYRALRSDDGVRAAEEADLPELDLRWARIVAAARADDLETARTLLEPLLEAEPRWGDYARLLAARDLLPHVEALLA